MDNTTDSGDALAEFLTTMPSQAAMLGPPAALVAVIILAVLCLSVVSQPAWWHACCQRKRRRLSTSAPKVDDFDPPVDDSSVDPNAEGRPFFSEADVNVVERFQLFQNSPLPLAKICGPAVISMAFCPVTLYLLPILVEFFWPMAVFGRPRPDVNGAVSCFLTPAGLVYAIAFGFAYQSAVEKMAKVSSMVDEQVRALEQAMSMLMSLQGLATSSKIRILDALKQTVIEGMTRLLHTDTKEKPHVKHIQRMCHVLQKLERASDTNEEVNAKLVEEMTSRLLCLDGLCYLGGMRNHGKIHFVQWLFLELLGFISFVGILLLRASSYRIELAFCVLTVFSITMVCYVLADFDDPFNGVFRKDLSIVVDVLDHIRNCYDVCQLRRVNQTSQTPPVTDVKEACPKRTIHTIK